MIYKITYFAAICLFACFGTNAAQPKVSAGPDRQLALGPERNAKAIIELSATPAAKGIPAGPRKYSWKSVKGPSGVVIKTPKGQKTAVVMKKSGAYVFRVTLTVGTWKSSDDVSIRVLPPPPPPVPARDFVDIVRRLNPVTSSFCCSYWLVNRNQEKSIQVHYRIRYRDEFMNDFDMIEEVKTVPPGSDVKVYDQRNLVTVTVIASILDASY